MLKQVLDGAKQEYDYILLDCTPPPWCYAHINEHCFDTMESSISFQSGAAFVDKLLRSEKSSPEALIRGILLTAARHSHANCKRVSTLIRQAYGSKIKVFDQTIPRSVRAAETNYRHGKRSIFQYDPRT